MKMRKACDKDLCDIRKLYMSAFPECERLVQLWRNGMSRVYTFDDDGFAGFISTLDSADVSLINFFAVDAGKRCGGIGSRALEEFLGMENGRRIFLEIERIMPHDGADCVRVRRKNFYIRHGFEPTGIFSVGEPQFEVSAGSIFIVEMPAETGIMPFGIGFGGEAKAVLHGAAQGDVGVDDTVGFGHNASVEAARFVVGRGAVVFNGFAHGLYFVGGKPSGQDGVGGQDFARYQVVRLAVAAQSRVVISRYGIDHTHVGLGQPGGQCQAFADDGAGMVGVVGRVERAVAGDDFGLDVGLKVFWDGV